jgi:hypothetical protein
LKTKRSATLEKTRSRAIQSTCLAELVLSFGKLAITLAAVAYVAALPSPTNHCAGLISFLPRVGLWVGIIEELMTALTALINALAARVKATAPSGPHHRRRRKRGKKRPKKA